MSPKVKHASQRNREIQCGNFSLVKVGRAAWHYI
jgi:hypothetical protein